MEITKDTLKAFRVRFAETVKTLETEYNVKITLGSISYGSQNFSGKITCTNTDKVLGENVTENQKAEFEMFAPLVGMKKEDYGKTILQGKKLYKIVGINPNAPKNCVILECGGKTYRGSASLVNRSL